MSKQSGFTLLELVIAMAIFALLGLASWGLFDGVVRVQQGTSAHERELRRLQRVVTMIERDLLHATTAPVQLTADFVQFQRSHWRNPLDLPRSERQSVSYRLDNGVLWRESQGEGTQEMRRQRLLEDVHGLSWRLFEPQAGWVDQWPSGQDSRTPIAIELQFSVGRFEAIRRVLPLLGVIP
ncbi:type II secretion system protein GspJ [Pseudomonas vancouverensis]|uniref:Type II secretion system protein J n=1 Tax=Pseudomonas vancouverensis TaxID=95300 RepID=A0A1H2PDF6_PSEVA|nr:type II secretion system protein GspJ [Pseudomonas vancouverensis]KAB0493855.1 prepilin-type N-terminal cleavage/methylation domain-containing protein [Pseudomonas vancouverensis]TDB58005.1 prepilin-type N-terminal cleavage/methylation domain-containing protein [Pseudomonas vancouverensis]SDV15026.1 general secretion pathway protein J [Pseudomonas vancouverensis]